MVDRLDGRWAQLSIGLMVNRLNGQLKDLSDKISDLISDKQTDGHL